MIAALPPCILFDLDGTLVDSLPGIEFSVREAFAACKLRLLTRDLRDLIGPPIRIILSRAGNVLGKTQLDALEKAFRVSYDSEGWRRTVSYPNAGHVLRSLRERGHRLFVVSNKPRQVSLQILEREQFFGYFEEIITQDSRSPAYRSKTEMLGTLLTGKLCSAGCALVGDTIEDAKAAVETGVLFIWMKHGYGNLSELPSIQVTYALDSFSQFYELMTKEPVLD